MTLQLEPTNNIEKVYSLYSLLISKKSIQRQINEGYFIYNFEINSIYFMKNLIDGNKKHSNFKNGLLPVLRVNGGFDCIYLLNGEFCYMQEFDVIDSIPHMLKDAQEVWEKVIRPELESFFDEKIDE